MVEFLLCVLIAGKVVIWTDLTKKEERDFSWQAGPFFFLVILFGTIFYLIVLLVPWVAEIAWEALKALF